MRTKLVQLFALLAFLPALPLAALDVSSVKQGAPVRHGNSWQQISEFEAPVKEGARLLLRADNGVVSINPVPGDKVSCTVTLHAYTSDEANARRLFDAFQLTARSVEAGGVYITSQSPQRVRHGASFRVHFQITVPQRYNLDVETQGGDISVESRLEGEARLTTAGGDVRTGDVTGAVRIETAGGSIQLGRIGSDLLARTAGGAIHVGDVKGDARIETSGGEIVTGEVAGALKAETAGGDIVVGGAAGQVQARTAGGQIQMGPTGGSVRAETAGGSILLQGARGSVRAETAGGSIDLLEVEGAVRASTAAGRILAEFNCTKKTFGPSQLETSMGDVYVYLPSDVPLTIDAAIDTAAGRQIRSDFPLIIQGDKEELVPSTLRGHGALNGGGEVLRIRTVAGNIEIRKIDEASLRELQQREDSNWKAWQEQRTQRERHQEQENERRQRQLERDGDDHDE
ncbi:MAG: DUF4097 family beta strand repeat-containing protein [Terriglobia bacterium]|jgi:hypothetical protein